LQQQRLENQNSPGTLIQHWSFMIHVEHTIDLEPLRKRGKVGALEEGVSEKAASLRPLVAFS
jgi:hypothetical protein